MNTQFDNGIGVKFASTNASKTNDMFCLSHGNFSPSLRLMLSIVTALIGMTNLIRSANAQSRSIASPLPQGEIDIPPGPYASWSDETRRAALFTANRRCLRCLIPGVMLFDNYKGPKEAMENFFMAAGANCLAKQMPEDWPAAADTREKFASYTRETQRLDPSLPSPDRLCSKPKP